MRAFIGWSVEHASQTMSFKRPPRKLLVSSTPSAAAAATALALAREVRKMNPANQDLHSLATEEELRYKARAVIAAGRPVLVSTLVSLLAFVGVSFGVNGSELPIPTKAVLVIVVAVPSLCEVWYLIAVYRHHLFF